MSYPSLPIFAFEVQTHLTPGQYIICRPQRQLDVHDPLLPSGEAKLSISLKTRLPCAAKRSG
jgi:hypothetical protein